MTSQTRILEILKSLNTCSWGWERNGVGHGEIAELEGRYLIHAPGFDGWYEPTAAGMKLLRGEARIDSNDNFVSC
jgi:hypothetical protein